MKNFKFFYTYSQSVKVFKENLFLIVPKIRAAKEVIVFYEGDKIKAAKFPFS